MGPLFGTIGGVGTWLALILKVAFALVGMGAYINLFLPATNYMLLAVVLAIALGALNLFGSKKAGGVQVLLVAGLLTLLVVFIGGGIGGIRREAFEGVFAVDRQSLLATAGLVYISYVGVTTVATLSEEVERPERNLPLGVFLALGTAIAIYGLGTAVMVGILEKDLPGDLTPVASATGRIFGRVGAAFASVAAILAFTSVANAGNMSASRYPLAMSRDHILPPLFRKLGRRGTPTASIVVTTASIVLVLLLFKPMKIAKLASGFQLLMFALVCLAVIVMRESRLHSYDPGYRSPLYPWMQIFGFAASLLLIFKMGGLTLLFSLALVIVGAAWYWMYARDKVVRSGAIYHIFERLGQLRYDGLDRELRGILKEKGLRAGDPFDEIIARGSVLDVTESLSFEEVVHRAAEWQSRQVPHSADEITQQYLDGTRVGATPVTHGVALPHLRSEGLDRADVVLVRSRVGVTVSFANSLTGHEEEQAVHAIFFLISPESDPTQHLRILAQIAERVEEESFEADWCNARDEQEIKEAVLRDDRSLSLWVETGAPTECMIGRTAGTSDLPDGCLVALLRRGGRIRVPHEDTVFEAGDRLTLVGDPDAMRTVSARFVGRRLPDGG